MTIGWLTSFDTDRPYEAREATALARVKSGVRTDYRWAKLTPPIERGDAGNADPLDVVLLAPRHAGDSLNELPVTHAIHVYVCTVKVTAQQTPTEVDPNDVVIRHWGVLYPSKESADSANQGST